MKLPPKVNCALLGFLVTLNLILRYPQTPHETGVDSFFIHTLAVSISNNGRAAWILNPLSFFGLYPLSYPGASPFLISDFSSISGVSVELSILLLSTTLGVVGMLTAYLMGRAMKADDFFAFSVAFLYSLAPKFLSFTMWTASSRNLFMALAPIFVWAIIRAYRRRNLTSTVLLVIFLGLLIATHRLAILVAVVAMAYLLSLAFLVLVRLLKLRFPKLFLSPTIRGRLSIVTLSAFAILAVSILFGTNVLGEYSQGELASGEDLQVKLLNLGASIGRSVGLALPLAFLGVVVVTRERNTGAIQPFILLTLLLLIPTLFLRVYTGFYILPFLAIAGAFGILGLARRYEGRRFATRVLIPLVFATILLVSTAVEAYDAARTTSPDFATYNTAIYLRTNSDGTAVSNDGLLGIRIAAYSSTRYMPVGGAGTAFQSPELLAFHFYSSGEVQARIVRLSLSDLTIESDSLFDASGIQAEADWEGTMRTPFPNVSNSTLERYCPVYFLENEALPGLFTAYGNIYPSKFALSVHDGSYRIYDSGMQSLWFVYPSGQASCRGP